MMMNCGDVRQVRPSFGSWVTYGLGSENQNLPGFIVLCPGRPADAGKPELAIGVSSRRLPGDAHRHARDADREADREHPQSATPRTKEQRRATGSAGGSSTAAIRSAAQNDALLEARIQSFELAYRMQMEADDAFDLSKEPEHIHKMYGEGVQAGR